MGELRLLVALLAVSTLSCGQTQRDAEDPEGDLGIGPDFVEGRRLWIRHLASDDGFERSVEVVHDSVRDEQCTFVRTADGKLRCMPSVGLAVNFYDYYVDAACSEPLFEWPLDDKPAYVSLNDADRCDPTYTFYETGAEFTGEEGFALVDGVCTPSPRKYGGAHYRRGDPLPLAAFVAAEVEVMAARGRLAEIHRHAEDGAMERLGLFDTEFGVECFPRLAQDGKMRCLPDATSFDRKAADCAAQQGGCTQTRFIAQSVEVACKSGWQFREIGPGCPIIPAERFVELAIDRSGASRLRNQHYVDGQGAGILAWDLQIYDAELQVECVFGGDVDGVIPCKPALASGRFSDAACADPIALVTRWTGACAPLVPSYVLIGEKLHRLGSRLAAEGDVFVHDAGTCERLQGNTIWEAYEPYGVGSEVEAGLAFAVRTAY